MEYNCTIVSLHRALWCTHHLHRLHNLISIHQQPCEKCTFTSIFTDERTKVQRV